MTAYADLAVEIRAAIERLPESRRDAYGFGLLVGDDEQLRSRRRAHARTVLLAQDALEEIVAIARQPVVLMKGLEVATLYPSATSRSFRDVDVLVADPLELWSTLSDLGYSHRPSRRVDLDHHHLPALSSPRGTIGIEVHYRPNTPGWAMIPPALVLETAESSRVGVDGLLRPRDDVHALLMALHCWKSGFTRLRDAYDAILLAASSPTPVDDLARELGVGGMWQWTLRFARTELLGDGSRPVRLAARVALPRDAGVRRRRRARLVAPFLCANPTRVVRSHVQEYRLGRAARQHVEA